MPTAPRNMPGLIQFRRHTGVKIRFVIAAGEFAVWGRTAEPFEGAQRFRGHDLCAGAISGGSRAYRKQPLCMPVGSHLSVPRSGAHLLK